MTSAEPRILLSIGTRPEIIKMAPIYLELKSRGLNPLLLHTGQHGDMATSLYQLFGIVPDFTLDLNRNRREDDLKGTELAELGSSLLIGCSKILAIVKPTTVLVHGDTSSALMMALAAFYQRYRVAHIEAGLRSYDDDNPFPEEKTRILIAQLAHIHFAPTNRARDNLVREGIKKDSIHVVGNTIVKAIQLGIESFEKNRKKESSDNYQKIIEITKKMADKKIILITTHRRENHQRGISSIAKTALEIVKTNKDMVVVWPVHPNPVVSGIVKKELTNLPKELAERIFITEPLNYPVFLWLMKNSWLILTDSGGIQEEAVALGTPVLVLRKTTERPELIEAGAGVLIGTNKDRILSRVELLYKNPKQYASMQNVANPFGDVNAVKVICNILLGTAND